MVADPRWRTLPEPDRAQAHRRQDAGDARRRQVAVRRARALVPARSGRRPLAPAAAARRRLRARQRGVHADRAARRRLVPSGPDFAAEPGSTQAFVGPDVPQRAHRAGPASCCAPTARRRERGLPAHRSFAEIFARDVASTVAAIWGTIMWCAYAPAFDGNEGLLPMFGEFLRPPLPGDEWVRWLPAAPLADLVALVRRAGQGAGHPARRAPAGRADGRHRRHAAVGHPVRPRAVALLTMLEPALRRPAPGRRRGPARRRRRTAGVARPLPPRSPGGAAGDRPGGALPHAMYDLVEALAFAPDPARAAATYLADLSDSRGAGRPRSTAGLAALRGLAPRGARRAPRRRRTELTGFHDPPRWCRRRVRTRGGGCWPRLGRAALRALHPPATRGHRTAALWGAGATPPERGGGRGVAGGSGRGGGGAGGRYAVGLAWSRAWGTGAGARVRGSLRRWCTALIHERDDSLV